MQKLLFTITSTIRPQILSLTLDSFNKHLNHSLKEYDCYINIDPSPCHSEKKAQKIIEITQKYFKTVVNNCPKTPNFSLAIKWLWTSANTPYIFHLEDDWILKKHIDIDEMIGIMKKNDYYQIRLTKFLISSATNLYGLSPCLISRVFYKTVAKNMSIDQNPERQLRNVSKWGLVDPIILSSDGKLSEPNGKVIQYPYNKVVIRDIGRMWRYEQKLYKPENEDSFISWLDRYSKAPKKEFRDKNKI